MHDQEVCQHDIAEDHKEEEEHDAFEVNRVFLEFGYIICVVLIEILLGFCLGFFHSEN